MADNVSITTGSDATVATDEISSAHYQIVKIGLGADGALDTLIDSGQQTKANSMPVVLASNQDALPITDNSGSITVDDGGTALAVKLDAQTSGGQSVFRSIDVDETEEEIKGSAGQLYGWFLFNGASATLYVKFYNATAATVTVGTTTPFLTIPIPAGAGANVSYPHGIAFDTAITIAATTGVADSDTGAPGANELIANIFYT